MRLGAVLYVYKGEWGLPSIDFECIRTMCLINFLRCPVKIDAESNPIRSGEGKLPYLQIGNEKFVGYRKIKDLLDKEGYPINGNLKDKDKFLSEAFTQFVFNQLHPYFNYFLFGDPANLETTRALYAKRTPFPFNFYFPTRYFKEATDVLSVFAGFELYEKVEFHDTDNLIINAKKCINILSKKLGSKVWFLGNYFSELDAIVYSYLSILYKFTSLPNNPIQLHIQECENLVNFIKRITRDIFKNDGYDSNKSRKASTGSDSWTSRDELFVLTKRKTQILSGLTAFLAMGSYAIWSGLLRISAEERYSDYDGYEMDDDYDGNED